MPHLALFSEALLTHALKVVHPLELGPSLLPRVQQLQVGDEQLRGWNTGR